MEVGVKRGAHFQLSRRGGRPSPVTWRNPIGPRKRCRSSKFGSTRNLLKTMTANLNQSRCCQYE